MSASHLDIVLEPQDGKVLKRSRTGCYTCRKRKKKCDESYEETGCARCREGGWKCIRPDPDAPAGNRPQKRRSPAQTPIPSGAPYALPTPVSSALSPSYTSALPRPPPPPSSSTFFWQSAFLPTVNSSTAIHHPSFTPVTGVPNQLASSSTSFHTATSPSLAPTSLPPIFPPALPAVYPPPPQDFLVPPVPYSDLNDALDALLAQLNEPTPPKPGGETTPWTPQQPHNALFSPSAFGNQPTPPSRSDMELDAGTDIAVGLGNALGLASGPAESEKCQLLLRFGQEYLVAAWSITYPGSAREAQVRKYLDHVARYPLARQASRSAAAAYLKLCQAGWAESALGGGGIGANLPKEFQLLEVDPPAMLNSTLIMFRETYKDIPLEAQLWILSDMHASRSAFSPLSSRLTGSLPQIAFGTLDAPTRSYEIATAFETALKRHWGASPTLNLAQMNEYSSFGLHAFAMIALVRSIAQRRPTYLTLQYEVPPAGEGTGTEGAYENWFGLPSSLAVLLSQTANLCAAAYAERASPTVPPDYEAQALLLIAKVEKWKPRFSVYDQEGERHPMSMASELTAQQESWRFTTLLLLHTLVLRRSPTQKSVAPLLRTLLSHLRAILVLSRSREREEPHLIDWWAAIYTTPAFLVGALVSGEEERAFVRRFLSGMGREPTLVSMIKVLEATWEASDEQGICVDWFEVAREKGWEFVFF
ncbi:hypothetical protein JCM6882_008695 [Rhodosporidiobolus microsporus]